MTNTFIKVLGKKKSTDFLYVFGVEANLARLKNLRVIKEKTDHYNYIKIRDFWRQKVIISKVRQTNLEKEIETHYRKRFFSWMYKGFLKIDKKKASNRKMHQGQQHVQNKKGIQMVAEIYQKVFCFTREKKYKIKLLG